MTVSSWRTTAATVPAVALLIVALFALPGGCGDENGKPVDTVVVTVDPSVRAGRLDPRYPGVAFDTAQLTGGMWWRAGSSERQVAEMPDLTDPRLRRLVSALSPLLIRIGGTDCDAVYFCPDPGPCEVPPAYRDTFIEDHRRETTLTQERITEVADFAEAVGAEILFCVNMGPGPRDPVTGEWTPDNARALIRFAKSLPNGDVFTVWEPGNEVNSFFLQFHSDHVVDASRFAADLVTFRALVDAEDPGASVSAPGSYVSPYGEIQNFTPELMALLDASGLQPIDNLSFHLYATQSSSCAVQIDMPDRETLFDETVNAQHRGHVRLMREAAGDLPVWNTESASAQCGGQQGVSDTLLDGLWYADWIGLMAEEGTRLLVRHSLIGADYSLIDPTFEPRPTFLALALYRRTVTDSRLHTATDRTRIKAHGYCAAGRPGDVTVVLVNPGLVRQTVELQLEGAVIRTAERWTLSAPEGFAASRALINGEPAAADGSLPEPPARTVTIRNGRARVDLDSAELAFVTVTSEPPSSACLD